jgi:glucokinase
VLLVNDFTAMGYGLLTLRDDECVVINNVPPKEGGVIATIGAGTGLGQCFLSKVFCHLNQMGGVILGPRFGSRYHPFSALHVSYIS